MRNAWFVGIVAALALAGCGGPDDGTDDPRAQGDDTVAFATDAEALSCAKDTWKNYGAAFFKTNCAKCHAIAFSTKARVVSSGAQSRISSGMMPRGKVLTAAQKKRILAWFTCGSP